MSNTTSLRFSPKSGSFIQSAKINVTCTHDVVAPKVIHFTISASAHPTINSPNISCGESIILPSPGFYIVRAFVTSMNGNLSEIIQSSYQVIRPDHDEYLINPNAKLEVQPQVNVMVVEKDLPAQRYACDERSIRGRVVILSNPVGHFNIIQPVGGCGGNLSLPSKSGRIFTPETNWNSYFLNISEADLEKLHRDFSAVLGLGCQIVTNAGFFNTANHDCFGNIVTNGKVKQTSSKHNVNFGIRDGKFYVGYLNVAEIVNGSRPFDTLVTGLVWLVRNGSSYVHESLYEDLEDMSAQSTGGSFSTVLSARTALGHDAGGRLMILQVEGETWRRGMTLYEFADLAVEVGFHSAINLDGGGSATMTLNHTLVSEPSWRCRDGGVADPTAEGIYRCEKAVSSITCIHAMPPPPTQPDTVSSIGSVGSDGSGGSSRNNNNNYKNKNDTLLASKSEDKPSLTARDQKSGGYTVRIGVPDIATLMDRHYAETVPKLQHALLVNQASSRGLAVLLILSLAINVYFLRVQAKRIKLAAARSAAVATSASERRIESQSSSLVEMRGGAARVESGETVTTIGRELSTTGRHTERATDRAAEFNVDIAYERVVHRRGLVAMLFLLIGVTVLLVGITIIILVHPAGCSGDDKEACAYAFLKNFESSISSSATTTIPAQAVPNGND